MSDVLRRIRAELEEDEHYEVTVEEVYRAISEVVSDRRFPPRVYGAEVTWNPSVDADFAKRSRDELAGEVVASLLGVHKLYGKQLAYFLDLADDVEHFRRLLKQQVPRILRQRLPKEDPVPRLLARARVALGGDPFKMVGRFDGHDVYAAVGDAEDPDGPKALSVPSDADMKKVTSRVAAIPRIPEREGQRASVIYSQGTFGQVMEIIGRELPAFTLQDVARIFRRVLALDYPTDLPYAVTTDIDDVDEDTYDSEVLQALEQTDPIFGEVLEDIDRAAELALGERAAKEFLEAVPRGHLLLLRAWDDGMDVQTEIAERLDVTTQTLRNWGGLIKPRLEPILELPPVARAHAMMIIRASLPPLP